MQLPNSLSAATDPSGAPWTAASITAFINALAYEQFAVWQPLNATGSICDDGTGTSQNYNEAACEEAQNQVYQTLTLIGVLQQQAQAIAANIAQGNTPSVVGPGAVNVTTLPSGQPVFVVTPTTPVAPNPTPAGAGGGSSSPTAQVGVGGNLPIGPSSGVGSSPATIAGTRTGDPETDSLGPVGFPFLPSVPKWLVIAGALVLGYALLSARQRA